MRIVFVFLMPTTLPVGGYKVAYEYANGLAQRGHQVTVAHRFLPHQNAGYLRNLIRLCKWKIFKRIWFPAWFAFDPRVKVTLIKEIDAHSLPDADLIFATAWETAILVAQLPPRCGSGCYLIQHFETWSGNKEQVLDTWRLPLKKFVISRWLEKIATEIGETSTYIPNGLNQDEFYVEQAIESRDPLTIGTLFHQHKWKGCDDVLAAAKIVKKRHPGLQLVMFGAYPEPEGLPDWVEYHFKPSRETLRALYNRMSIFVSASKEEGWGLTPCEALMCGAAIAVSDNGGHREFAKDGETALMFPVGDITAAADAINRLIDSPDTRRLLASNGKELLSRMDWSSAVSRLEKELLQASGAQSPA